MTKQERQNIKSHILEKVLEFQRYYNVSMKSWANVQPMDLLSRETLQREEFDELCAALNSTQELDALLDMAYITAGTIVTLGLRFSTGMVQPLALAQAEFCRCLRDNPPKLRCLNRAANNHFNAVVETGVKKFGAVNFFEAFNEVHNTNMLKGWTNDDMLTIDKNSQFKYFHRPPVTVVKRLDGKIMKPPSWKAPDLERFTKD